MAAPPAFKPPASLQLQEVRSLCKKEVKALCDEKWRHGDPVAPPACGRAHLTQPVGPPSPVHYHYTLLPNLPSVAPPQAGLTPPKASLLQRILPSPSNPDSSSASAPNSRTCQQTSHLCPRPRVPGVTLR
ncbi:unnamed protein product [Gulo gulo]|uniref:Uncharacterized protein n=1 Tax=Gulo gulo TaxID=48420 RepID=A0A9X9LH69_GULGU|nr:unnamed protein product [Gulo gulo]